MLNKDILGIIEYILDKEQSTNVISIDTVNQLLPVKLTQYINDRVKEYLALSEWERSQKINLVFSQLKTQKVLSVTNGVAVLPTDPDPEFLLIDKMTYTQTITTPSRITKTIFKGVGLNDCSSQGVYSDIITTTYGITIDSIQPVSDSLLINPGTGYSANANIPVKGGKGTGLTIDILTVDGNGLILTYQINNPGSGYVITDILTIVQNGGLSGQIQVTNVVNYDTFKFDVAGITQTSGVAITGGVQNLQNGVSVAFISKIGHTLNDRWAINCIPAVSKVKEREIDECSGSEFGYRQTVQLEKPTEKHPISQIVAQNLQILPTTISQINFQYIRRPKTPYLDWYMDNNDNIIYRDQAEGASQIMNGSQEITTITLSGITNSNSDNGHLYWSLIYASYLYTLNIYSDYAHTKLVASGSVSVSGTMTISGQNNSGISGSCTVTVHPYLTVSGNDLSEIYYLSMDGLSGVNYFYWEIKCVPFLLQGNLAVTTTLSIYTDTAKTNIVFRASQVASNLSGQVIFTYNGQKATGNYVLQNCLSFVISAMSPSMPGAVSNFMVFYPILYNQNIFYYTLTDNGINRVFNVYSDSNRSLLLMSGTQILPYTRLLQLNQNNNNGYSGYVQLVMPLTFQANNDNVYLCTVSGDGGAFANLILNGISGTTLYFTIVSSGGRYNVNIYSDDAHTTLIATGSVPVNGTVTILGIDNGIWGTVYLTYTVDKTDMGQTITPQVPPHSQLSNIVLSGITASNTDNGILYFEIYNYVENPNGSYTITLFKDSDHRFIVASGSINSTTGVVIMTSSYGISGTIDLIFLQNNKSSLNEIVISSNYSHVGEITYTSGDWDITNTIETYQEDDPENNFLALPVSKTVEIELRDEDKIVILGMLLKDIGVNVGNDKVVQYANDYMK